MLPKGTLRLCLKLLLVVLNLIAKHTATILGFHFNLMLELSELLFILSLFLSFELQDFPVCLLLQFSLLFLKFALKVSLQVLKLNIEL